MEITKHTLVSDILKEHGDLAEIMEIFGLTKVGSYRFRKFITQFITVRTAAFVHHVPLDRLIKRLRRATKIEAQLVLAILR